MAARRRPSGIQGPIGPVAVRSPVLAEFLARVKSGERVSFKETIALIGALYDYQPAAFSSGLNEERLDNAPGSNEVSCKIFAFAKMNGLSERETLALFGDYYFKEVLEHPAAASHRNIRNFLKYGWKGILFLENPLARR